MKTLLCKETIQVIQPCDCHAVLTDPNHHIPIIITFGGRSYSACYNVDDSTSIRELCLPAGVPIGHGGNYTIVYTSGNGSTVTETGTILTGGGDLALCEKTAVVVPPMS